MNKSGCPLFQSEFLQVKFNEIEIFNKASLNQTLQTKRFFNEKYFQ